MSSETEGAQEYSVHKQSYLADLWDLAWLPLLLGLISALVTWAVWSLTTEPCTATLAKTTGCSLSGWARYINLELLNKIFAHGAIAGGAGGIGNYIMLRRERERADAAERRLAEERKEAAEERKVAAEERKEAAEERQELINRILELTRPPENAQEEARSESN